MTIEALQFLLFASVGQFSDRTQTFIGYHPLVATRATFSSLSAQKRHQMYLIPYAGRQMLDTLANGLVCTCASGVFNVAI